MFDNNSLLNYAVESGEVLPEESVGQNEALTEVLVEEAVASPSETAGALIEQAEQSAEIAEQLEELAERAEEVAEKAQDTAEKSGAISAEVVVATESLQREYGTLMRAYKLKFPATSFEAAGSDIQRLQGLAADSRRVAGIARGHRDNLLDYSEEGAILSFLRRDASKLSQAHASLLTTSKSLQARVSDVKEKPVAIRNNAYARFMTRNGVAVRDLPKALREESASLQKMHDAIVAAAAALSASADQLAKGTPASNIANRSNIFGALNGMGTAQGAMMGNITFVNDGIGNGIAGIACPKFSRRSETKANGKDILFGAWGAFSTSMFVNAVAGLIVIGGLSVGAPILLTVAAAGAVNAARIPAAAYGAYKGTTDSMDSTEVKSQAGVRDLQEAINLVSGFGRYTEYRVDAEAISEKIKAARAAGKTLAEADRKLHYAVCDQMETSLSRLIRLGGLVYEQAFYDTTLLAAMINTMVNKY